MKTCVECNTVEITRDIYCVRCGVIQTLFVRATSKLQPGDVHDFCAVLRSADVKELLLRKSAWVLQSTMILLVDLAGAHDLDADSLRVSLATRLSRNAEYLSKVVEYERQNGPGSYRKSFSKMMAAELKPLYATHPKAKPHPEYV